MSVYVRPCSNGSEVESMPYIAFESPMKCEREAHDMADKLILSLGLRMITSFCISVSHSHHIWMNRDGRKYLLYHRGFLQ